ncbi:NUDIX hydrolase [Kribbia dieselivorans]|uniref:NUDIX hydrolase n=1 Tax=Kribbia dieselivorans TaxID=331526 RepID=UPI0008393FFE|nr:hypothetical protein [Kribbia dieselivorans]
MSPIQDQPVPGRLGDFAQEYLANPAVAATPKNAATVMFVRDRDDASGVEVFMLKRVASMAFAPSTFVFPGGGTDQRDAAEDLPWAGPDAAVWAERFGTDEGTARMLVATAVREVFEECGVLLAAPGAHDDLVTPAGENWERYRAQLIAHETALHDVLLAEGLVLRSDLLTYRAFWTTPVFEPKRYATRFFIATVPAGQDLDGATTEAETSGWYVPSELLQQSRDGEVLMLPPTIHSLEQLAEATSAQGALTASYAIKHVMPELVETEDGLRLRVDLPD